MSRSRILRLLRIAFSALCGIACLLLVMLWMRSYGTWDRCFRTWKNHGWQLNSMVGHLALIVAEDKRQIPFFIAHEPTEDRFDNEFNKNLFGFKFERTPGSLRLEVPFWFIVPISMAMANASWVRHLSWRFSLRTLLIATTLVAALLGAIAYAIR